MSAVELKKQRELVDTLLDVREQDEWISGHIDGAVHIPLSILGLVAEERIPDKESCIVIYCRSGARTVLAHDLLMKQGYKNVQILDGGYEGYLLS